MKKIGRIALAIAIMLAMIITATPAVKAIEAWNGDIASDGLTRAAVVFNGVRLDADAYILNDRTVVPLRAIFTALSIPVDWDGTTQTVTATQGTKVIQLRVGITEATINGQPTALSVPPVLIDGRTYVPLRFVAESTGASVSWDDANMTAIVQAGPQGKPGQVHKGTINQQGETWTFANSPHFVEGDFRVEGKNSPVLVIEPGALVLFKKDASIIVGQYAPGGLMVNGQADNRVTLKADSTSAQPGFWKGIRFYAQTIKGQAVIQGASIQTAGGTGTFTGGIYVEGKGNLVEVQVIDTEIKDSQYAGINLWEQGRLAEGSNNLTITGTKSVQGKGGFPISTSVFGSNNLPAGTYAGNDYNAVHLFNNGSYDTVAENTTWKNIGIPYASSFDVNVQGSANPTLTIEPGVVTLWKSDAWLTMGYTQPGTLVADATGGGQWTIDKTALDIGVKIAKAGSDLLKPQADLSILANNHTIIFAAWDNSGARGGWEGIRFLSKAGDQNQMIGTVVAYGGKDANWSAGIYVEEKEAKPVKLLLADSLVTGAARLGVFILGSNVGFSPSSTGNYFVNNATALEICPPALGSLKAGNTIANNDKDVIIVWSSTTYPKVTETATWSNLGVPYNFKSSIWIAGSQGPVITIQPGTKLIFANGTEIKVGEEAMGSLVAAGVAVSPIVFTSELGRPGTWGGLYYGNNAGDNKLQYVTIEYADKGVELRPDLMAFMINATIRGNSVAGVWRLYNIKTGTSLLPGNTFESNAVDQH